MKTAHRSVRAASPQRSRPVARASGATPTATVMRLQGEVGNRAVASMLTAGEAPTGAVPTEAGEAPPMVQRLVALGSFAPPAKPRGTAPSQHPGFRAMKARTHQSATKLRAHPSAASETHQAQQAVVPPGNDAASQAKAAAVEDMSGAKPGVFDKAAFMAAVRTAIEKAAPKDNKEADEFKSSGKADAVKQQVKGQVAAGKDASAADIKGKSEAPPDPSKAQVKPVTAMEPTKQPDTPPDPGAAAAMPARAPPEQTNLSGAPNEVNAKMADAHVSEQQLANSNEPAFQDALAAKKTGEAHSAAAPAGVRAQESQAIAGAQAGATGAAKGALGAMVASKVGALGGVGGKKDAAKSADEGARQRVASQIEAIYQHTKTDAETILKDLDGKVDTTFEKGEAEAKAAFEEYHSSRVTDWKVKRYLLPVGGLIQWGIDQFKPLSPELIKIFTDARAVYMQKMDAVISSVADLIGTELTRARTRIAQGRAEIKDFVGQQKGDLAKVAKDAESSIGAKFDDLDKSVDDKQAGMVDDLAEKYVEARKGIDERITALQDENKGLWEQAKGAVAGAIDTILKLKDMLLGVLARAQGAVQKIIDDPMKFLGNLIAGVRSGLDRFVSNIAGHLKKGLMGWLFGELSNAGIELPEKFDLKGIFNLVASILGLSWANFRTRLVAKVGEKTAGRIEQGLDFVKAIASGGLGGAWQFIVTKIGNLKDMVMDQVKEFVITKVVMAGVQWLIGLLNPAAAFVKACKMIYDVIMWFVDNGQRIKEFVDSILDSVESIVAGNIGKVASMIEDSLAKILPLAIGFLASLLGLGGLGEKIKKILLTVQKPVNKVFDFLIGKAVKFGKGILSKLKNSKLGKAAAKAKDKAKAAYAKGKAYVKGKAAAARKWVKGKAQAVGQALGIIRKPFSVVGEQHTLSADPKTGQIRLASVEGPVETKVRERVKLMQARWAAEHRPVPPGVDAQVASVMGQINRTRSRIAAAKAQGGGAASTALDDLSKVIVDFFVKLGPTTGTVHPPTPGVGNIAPHGGQVSSNRNDPLPNRHLESEHVIPFAVGAMIFSAVGARLGARSSESGIDGRQHTVMIYKSAADHKTSGGTGGDSSIINQLKSIRSSGAPTISGNNKWSRSRIPEGSTARTLPIADRRRMEEGFDAERRQTLIAELPGKLAGIMSARVDRTIKAVQAPSEHTPEKIADRGHDAVLPEPDRIRSAAAAQAQDLVTLISERLVAG